VSSFIPDLPGIDGLLGDPDGPVGQEIERLGLECETVAKRLAPVSHLRQDIPGLLRDSITHYIQMYKGAPGAVVGSPVRYALFVEYGTVKMTARPFLRPALFGLKI
jgi:hypothetical protein